MKEVVFMSGHSSIGRAEGLYSSPEMAALDWCMVAGSSPAGQTIKLLKGKYMKEYKERWNKPLVNKPFTYGDYQKFKRN